MTANDLPAVIVQPTPVGLAIVAYLPESDLAIQLRPGESFGGHEYGEWQAVRASSRGIPTEWLLPLVEGT